MRAFAALLGLLIVGCDGPTKVEVDCLTGGVKVETYWPSSAMGVARELHKLCREAQP